MNRTHACILALLLGVAAPVTGALANVPATLIEASVEAAADDLSLPADESGIITVRACAACAAQTFYFAKQYELILGGRRVELKQMSEALHRAGTAAVTVHFRRTDQQVTRIVMAMLPPSESSK